MRLLRVGLLITITVCYLTGCAGLVIGGAAAGGYYVAKDKRSSGEIVEDATITSSINAKYVKDDLVSALDVNVDTYRGVVTLNGLVANKAAATRAIDLALSTKNVTKVISNLTIRDQALSPRGVVYQ
jgi:osmotically-inducible protein OsmY